MNIGILGLLPEQVRQVQLEFPAHALRFLSKDRQSETGTFAKGCDKVVLMTKFIGHDMQDRVPPSKRLFVNGGIVGLRRELQKMPTPARDVTPAKASPLTLPPANADAVDWSPLDNAQVGDVVRIARPSRVSIKLFEGRVTAGRSYRKKTRGIVTTAHKMVDGFAVMTVKAVGKAPTPDAVATIETGPPDATPPTAPQENAAMQIAVEVQRPLSVSPTLAHPRESAFWQSVFVETMRQWPGAPIDTIAARADEALRAYNARATLAMQSSQH